MDREYTFTDVTRTVGAPAVVKVSAIGDLDLASEFLVVRVNGQVVGTLFDAVGAASDCPVVSQAAQLSIDPALYATLAFSGNLTIRVEPSIAVSSTQCANGMLVVHVHLPEPFVDCNGNARHDPCDIELGGAIDCNGDRRIDSCQIQQDSTLDCNANGTLDTCDTAGTSGPLDCDGNELVDACEIAANPDLDCNSDGVIDTCDIASGAQDKDADGRLDACEYAMGDFDLDGIIGGPDLAGLLGLWGLPKPPYGDLDGNGTVGGGDLAILLNRWGPLN